VNYHQARERRGADGEGTGRWCFTTKNDGQVWVNPSCAPHHEEGHADAIEASHCFYEYELAQEISESKITSGYLECVVCGGPCRRLFRIGHYLFESGLAICEKHDSSPESVREIAQQQRPFDGEIAIAASW
jgi:hypothetical protein